LKLASALNDALELFSLFSLMDFRVPAALGAGQNRFETTITDALVLIFDLLHPISASRQIFKD